MNKDDIDTLLLASDPDEMYHVYIISYNRMDGWPTYKSLAYMDPIIRRRKVHLVVEEDQRHAYEARYLDVNIIGIPPNHRDAPRSSGRARQAAMDFALAAGHYRIIMLDDDLLHMRYLYAASQRNGTPKSGYCLAPDYQRDPLLVQHLLTLFSRTANDVFDKHPEVLLGSGRKQQMSQNVFNHQTKYAINRGMTPRQFMAHNVAGLAEANISLDLPWFGPHGEDIGLVAQVLDAGYSVFHAPTFVYDVWAEDVNIRRSVIRNIDTAPALHQLEWGGLHRYDIGYHYLKSTTSILDGSYEWGEVDWRAYHRFMGTNPVVVPWDAEAELARALF
jgi:hypothetical protein